jgi:hypothetical protein
MTDNGRRAPRPGENQIGISGAEYARRCGVSRQAIFERDKNGLIVRFADRSVDPVASDELFARHGLPAPTPVVVSPSAASANPLDDLLLPGASDNFGDPGEPPSATASLNVQRARKTKAEAGIAELKLLRASGDMIDKREAARAWFAVIRMWRNRMRSIPSRLASQLVTLDEAEARMLLADEIDDALLILPDEVPVDS